MIIRYLLPVIGGYIIGSVPTAWLVGKIYGVDILTLGSRNMGATNVRRVLGWKPALIVLGFDIAKGMLSALIWLFLSSGSLTTAIIASFSALVGHIYPLPLNLLAGRIRGGRGVAAAIGSFIVPTSPSLSWADVLQCWNFLLTGYYSSYKY